MRLLTYVMLFVTLSAHGADDANASIQKRMQQLKSVIGAADRLEIRTTAVTVDEKGRPFDPGPYTVIERPEVATEFLQYCVISDAALLPPCLCEGELYVEFYRGSNRLARLYYHKEGSIDWFQGPWQGFAPIKSNDKLTKWFRERGAARELTGIPK